MKIRNFLITTALVAITLSVRVQAQIKVGVTLSTTGPAAALGTAERNVFDILPKEIAGQKVEYIFLDDGSDPNTAVRNARKLIDEDKVDILMGGSTSPNCLAIVPVAGASKTPFIAMGAASAIVEPMDDIRRWVFKTVHNDSVMMDAVVKHMVKNGVKRVGYVGLADASGQGFLKALREKGEPAGINFVAIETYQRTDQSTLAQVLKLMSIQTDAIFISAHGAAAATPQIDLFNKNYKGKVYHTHGVAVNDFLRVSGKASEGVFVPMSPVLIAEQIPDSHPSKKVGLALREQYNKKFQDFSIFAGNSWDAFLLFQNAVPTALKAGKPGTPEFRAAIRDAIEKTKDFAGAAGVYSMTPTDHVGLDERSRFITQIQQGKWVLVK
jgi:branched-chain amino acid transport system substrate-binding protein